MFFFFVFLTMYVSSLNLQNFGVFRGANMSKILQDIFGNDFTLNV